MYLASHLFQVHGIVNDTVAFVRGILTTEINSATDNPVSFLCEMVGIHEIEFSVSINRTQFVIRGLLM